MADKAIFIGSLDESLRTCFKRMVNNHMDHCALKIGPFDVHITIVPVVYSDELVTTIEDFIKRHPL